MFLFQFSQGAARRLTTQRKSIEVVESVGVAGKSGPNRTVKYFRLEVNYILLQFITMVLCKLVMHPVCHPSGIKGESPLKLF